jgi:ABC-2 type transport system permease protein
VFVDPATMPGWVQAFVKVNPVTHLTDASRALMHGYDTGRSILWVALWCIGFLVVFFPLTMRAYNRER